MGRSPTGRRESTSMKGAVSKVATTIMTESANTKVTGSASISEWSNLNKVSPLPHYQSLLVHPKLLPDVVSLVSTESIVV